MQRVPLSLKSRFSVFKRDGFVCQYCGRTPPSVTLEVDHIIPVSKKGDNSIDNLITSCFDCNRGKSNIELSEIPKTILEKSNLLKEKELQYKSYQRLLLKIDKRKSIEVDLIQDVFIKNHSNFALTESSKNSVKKFISELGYYIVLNAAESANKKIPFGNKYNYDVFKYFCGICWQIIKTKNNG